MTLNGGSYYSSKSRHSVLPLEIPGKRYSPQFRGVVIGTVVGQELTAGGWGVNIWSSLPMGCTEEVKDLFKKQTMLLRAVETVDSGNRPFVKTEGVVITGSALIEDLIVYLLIAESYRIFEGNAFGTQEVETDCLNVDDLSDLA
ncbi:hypothetical protein B0H13DRAFT_1904481 [Mycena leptocephala]|nr:hypothetical protein B0H13DRAFT_1904481 [Mycena leptocephala]